MSVYTTISESSLVEFLSDYDIGSLRAFEGISDGIENTNYFVTSAGGEFVLTLFEATPAADLPYFLDLMAHLAEHGVPSAHPVAARDGSYLRILADKPAALVARLHGRSALDPQIWHCAAVGEHLARLHLAGLSFSEYRDDDRGTAWRVATAEKVRGHLDEAQRALLEEEIEHQRSLRLAKLPGGVIHADLFRDNALFDDLRLTGIIDFYYAHHGAFIYDLAVLVSDWCFAADGGIDAARMRAIASAYGKVRPLAADEIDEWLPALRAAGLRFWLSRLHDLYFPRSGAITQTKDPAPFERVIRAGRAEGPSLTAAWK